MMSSGPQGLDQELRDVQTRIQGLRLNRTDLAKRMCNIHLSRGNNSVEMELSFPVNYPFYTPPAASIKQCSLDSDTQSRLLKVFNDTCSKYVSQTFNCVEPSMRQVMSLLEKQASVSSAPKKTPQLSEEHKQRLDKKFVVEKVKTPTPPSQPSPLIPMYPTGSFQDSCVPFPRTSGAHFCANDRLVIFGVPATMKKVYEDAEITPRALSDLVAYTSSQSQWLRSQTNSVFPMSVFYGSPPTPVSEGISISNWFTEKLSKSRPRHTHRGSHSRSHDSAEARREKEREAERQVKRRQKVGSIKLYDISGILPVNKYLAESYIIDLNDVKQTCEHNASVAKKIGRKDLVQLWNLVCEMSHDSLRPSPNVDSGPPWAIHPFGRGLAQKLLDHYGRSRDVQTMAMICCMFWDGDSSQKDSSFGTTEMSHNESRLSFEYAAANSQLEGLAGKDSVLLGSSGDSGWHVLPVMKSKRSLSWSECYDDFKILEDKDPREREVEKERLQHHNSSRILDPEKRSQYEEVKKAYADILYSWGLLNQRSQILKHTSSVQSESQSIKFPVNCFNCAEEVHAVQCNRCKYPALRCSICHIGVRGAANMCLACGHGGHTAHMVDWFATNSVCPTGCGCLCLEENSVLGDPLLTSAH